MSRSTSRSYLIVDRADSLSLSPSPDHLTIEPETPTATIGIEEIRDLKTWAQMKPFQTTLKIVLIKKAQNLTVEAQNAMLKLLEEPPEATMVMLTVDDAKNLLPPVVSRCAQIFNFQFSIFNQFSIFKEEKTFGFSSPSTPSFSSIPSLPTNLSDRFAFAEELSSQGKETVIQTLNDWLKNLYHKLHQEKNPSQIAQTIKEIETTRQAILKNANARLALENLMLKLHS